MSFVVSSGKSRVWEDAANVWISLFIGEKCVQSFPHICNFLSSQRQIFQKFLQNFEFPGIACHSLTSQASTLMWRSCIHPERDIWCLRFHLNETSNSLICKVHDISGIRKYWESLTIFHQLFVKISLTPFWISLSEIMLECKWWFMDKD